MKYIWFCMNSLLIIVNRLKACQSAIYLNIILKTSNSAGSIRFYSMQTLKSNNQEYSIEYLLIKRVFITYIKIFLTKKHNIKF